MPKTWWQTKRATHIELDPFGPCVCTYHDTPIVRWNEEKGYPVGTVTLLLGSIPKHDSQTTRRRMNEVADHYGLPYRVFREKGETFAYVKTQHKCSKRRERLSFTDYTVSFTVPAIAKDCPDCALTMLAKAGE